MKVDDGLPAAAAAAVPVNEEHESSRDGEDVTVAVAEDNVIADEDGEIASVTPSHKTSLLLDWFTSARPY